METIPSERFFQSDIGTDIRASLFENYYPTMKKVIQNQIIETVERYEPRVANLEVQINAAMDDNAFEVTVLFEIVGLEVPIQSFSFLLEPTR